MLAATVALLFPLIAEGAADVHKCRDAKGVIVYTDRPCAKDAATLAMPNEPLKDAPVTWQCEAQMDKNEPKLQLVDLPEIQRQTYLASGYGEGFLRLTNARHFNINGSFFLCDETKGKSPSQLVEMVITPEGHLWMRRDGRVTHLPPTTETISEIKPASQ
jgi:hypothetical protein